MHARDETRSFGSTLARDELTRLRDEGPGSDSGPAQLFARDNETPPCLAPARPTRGGPLFNIAELCNLFQRMVWRSKRGEAPNRTVPS